MCHFQITGFRQLKWWDSIALKFAVVGVHGSQNRGTYSCVDEDLCDKWWPVLEVE